jgi:hypothetical protein
MATLADINKSLKEQNKAQDETTKSVSGLSANFKTWLTGQKVDKLKDLETQRESTGRFSAIGGSIQRAGASGISGLENIAGSAAGTVGGLLSRMAGLIPAAFALVGSGQLISLLASGIKRRGIPALLANIFADRIGDAVKDFTGSSQVGDAVQRGLKLGSFGLLLGKRFALISAAIGALLTKENQEKVGELGDELLETSKKLNLLPKDATFESVLSSIQTGAGKALTALTAVVKGDFASKDFTDNWGSLAVAAAGIFTLLNPFGTIGKMVTAVVLAYKTLKGMGLLAAGAAIGTAKGGARFLGNAVSATTGAAIAMPSGPGISATDLAEDDLKLENKRRIDKLNRRQLKKLSAAGYRVQGGVLQKLSPTGSAMALSNAGNIDNVLSNVAGSENKLLKASKIGNFGKFIKIFKAIPYLGTLFSIYELASIVGDDTSSMDQKIESIGRLFGSVFGGVSGAAVVGLMGTAVGGPIIGTILGGVAGALGGDAAGKALAQYMMGKPIDAFGNFLGADDALNAHFGLTTKNEGFNYSQAAMAQGMADAQAYTNQQGGMVAAQVADYFYNNVGREYGGGAPIINAPSTVDASTTNTQAAVVPSVSVTDRDDPTR